MIHVNIVSEYHSIMPFLPISVPIDTDFKLVFFYFASVARIASIQYYVGPTIVHHIYRGLCRHVSNDVQIRGRI